jgi:hypothetical protein
MARSMASPVQISLRYIGPEVDTGEMDVNEVATALQGFASAYSKVAARVAPEAHQQLKVTAIRESSFDLFIAAALVLTQSGDMIEKIETVTNAAKYTFRLVTEVMNLKKHTKAQPYTTQINGNNHSITVINAEKVECTISLPAFEMYREKLLDPDLNKITAPLREGRVEEAQLKDEEEGGPEARIKSDEREYFRPSIDTTKQEREVRGTLVSLNKETNRGTFKFGNGSTARYAYVGDNKERFHHDFSLKGPVSVIADVAFDENLTPIHLDIRSVEPTQTMLDLRPQPPSRLIELPEEE